MFLNLFFLKSGESKIMKKKILISAACVLAALVAAGVLAWYFLCVQVQGIYAETLPLKTTYYVHEEFDLAGLCVKEEKRIQNFNSEIPLEKLEIFGFDSSEESERQEIFVKYGKFETAFYITIKPLPEEQKNVIKIQLQAEEGYELKTEYYCFEPLQIEHMRLLVTYSDASTELLPVQAEYVSGFDNREPAEHLEVRITYGGFFTRFYVNITLPENE